MELKTASKQIFSLLGIDTHTDFTEALRKKIYSNDFAFFCDKCLEWGDASYLITRASRKRKCLI